MVNVTEAGYSPSNPESEINYVSSDPNTELGFEISPTQSSWSIAPEFYPDDFTQMKKTELTRYGGDCGGETVTIKSVKNREFHVEGVILQGEINLFQGLLDLTEPVDLLSPLTPTGGMECHVKQGELGNQTGFDPHNRQWMFKYNLDLVSTGRDEYNNRENAIVSAVLSENDESGSSQKDDCTFELSGRTYYRKDAGLPKSNDGYQDIFNEWQNCSISTSKFEDLSGGEQLGDLITVALNDRISD